MRKVVVSVNVTIDGFMAGDEGDLNWHLPYWTEEMSRFALQQLAGTDTVLLGRKTYDTMASYWPAASSSEFGWYLNNCTKIIFSRTLDSAAWENSYLIKKNIESEIIRLKKLPGRDMIVLGSRSIINSLMRFNLTDEYRIWIFPVAIGSGFPLFKKNLLPRNFRLLKTKAFDSGVMILYYQPV